MSEKTLTLGQNTAEQSCNIALNSYYKNKICPMNAGLMQDMPCDVDDI